MKNLICAYCNGPAEGNYAVHKYGMGDGPEVQLCDGCGEGIEPTLDEIWAVTGYLTEEEKIIRNIVE